MNDTVPDAPLVSAFVVCMNEEKNIQRCLESIKWCDEIVVIDSGSTDRTLEISREYNARIFQRPWPGYVEQKRFGLEHCSGTWVLNLDADEEVSPELRDEILARLKGPNAASCNGFLVNRVVFYLGRWWRKGGWYPEFRLRLCRRSATSWGGDDPHERAIVEGKTERLVGELRHYTYDDMTDHVNRLNKFSFSAARTLQRKGKKFKRISLCINPVTRFIKFYLLKRGYREGFAGFVIAVLESYYVFLKYAKQWELENSSKKE